ncbi:unnamed protein product [Dovyalis caffra]|uniref:Diacylglycerol O-acyltransferase n=1 Tax=Dovyalis caffra TaxID=77055 RepID=A0AAV1QQM9_9ROSI|nr:unnamed protein product [Dovyalis caffra]
MENIIEEAISEPVSPTGQFLSSSVLSLCVIGVLESEVPIDDSQTMPLLKTVFLPINPRFSSIMVTNEDGEKRWKRVEVRLEDHINVPIFASGMSPEFYDECLDDYLSKIAMENFPESRPKWEIHIIKYPTSHAAGNVIFKLHHSLGDGFSLMGALLSCLQRADNPSLPLTFPSIQLHTKKDGKKFSMCRIVPKFFSSVLYTVSDFFSSITTSCLIEDDKTPIRSSQSGVEFLPVSIATMTFSLDDIKQIKSKLGVMVTISSVQIFNTQIRHNHRTKDGFCLGVDVRIFVSSPPVRPLLPTLNDVITGTIFLGTRLYMEALSPGSGKASTTSLVLLNTRMFVGYKSIQEMVKPNAELPWGNHFAFLNVSIPKLTDAEAKNPLQFVLKARQIIKRKRMSSFAVYLTAKYLQLVKKIKGPKGASKYIYGTMKNTSMGITNVMGPIEQMALANHPVKGLYFVVTGAPQTVRTLSPSRKNSLVAPSDRCGSLGPKKPTGSETGLTEIRPAPRRFLVRVKELVFGQGMAPSPAPEAPSNDGKAIDQGIAYALLLLALAITYLIPD